jgi:hypothetical protein
MASALRLLGGARNDEDIEYLTDLAQYENP